MHKIGAIRVFTEDETGFHAEETPLYTCKRCASVITNREKHYAELHHAEDQHA